MGFVGGMFKIIDTKRLNSQIVSWEVESGEITRHAKPGQFIVLRIDETGERIPLTIYDMDKTKKTISLIFQEVGKSTHKMGRLTTGDSILDLIGPLGHATDTRNFGSVLCVGGGVGSAPLFPIVRALIESGNDVTVVLGFKTADLIILEDRFKELFTRAGKEPKVFVTTDDGSNGTKGLVTDVMKKLMQTQKFDRGFAIGPLIMMKFAVAVFNSFGVPAIVSLNTVMVDGTGMCGGCRCTVGGQTRFVCVDGPEFEGAQVNFDELLARQNRYHRHEQHAMDLHKEHVCRLDR
ncbi:MAG: sulfide/dihydroorotate dehydrogenase-like FAD/NAD-binding protein [Chitinivibrionales bacterium]|nr:sulfide/dihydroorotate dehydrogenase-like FAD/NAD-binding protein [Chitinivibrionales bacterium]